MDWLHLEARTSAAGFGGRVEIDATISGEAFLTQSDAFVQLCADEVQGATGVEPVLSTTGGTSDARFIRDLCPVIEFGLVGATMHMVDERVETKDVLALSEIYRRIIQRYFQTFTPDQSS